MYCFNQDCKTYTEDVDILRHLSQNKHTQSIIHSLKDLSKIIQYC